jgi:hypothetical protein
MRAITEKDTQLIKASVPGCALLCSRPLASVQKPSPLASRGQDLYKKKKANEAKIQDEMKYVAYWREQYDEVVKDMAQQKEDKEKLIKARAPHPLPAHAAHHDADRRPGKSGSKI